MTVGVYIDIAYIMPTIGGIGVICWVSLALRAQGRGHVCQLVFSLILHISCQQLGGCKSVGVYIGIVYIMPTIGGICVICWVSLGPSGPGYGGCMTVGVYIDIAYIMPTIGGMYISWSLH